MIKRRFTLLFLSSSFFIASLSPGQNALDHDEQVKTYRSLLGSQAVKALLDKSVQAELEMVGPQVGQLNEIRNELFQELQSLASGFNRDNTHLPGDELQKAREDFRQLVKEKSLAYETQANSVLLPHQQLQLQQLIFRRMLSQMGPTRILLESGTSSNLAKALALTDEQLKKLKQVSEKAKKDLVEKIELAKKEATEEILSVLSPSQRKTFDNLLGTSTPNNSKGIKNTSTNNVIPSK